MPTRSEPASRPAAAPAASPPPARVPANRWTAIEVAGVGALAARERVSVLVSGPDPGGRLPLTLAALAAQSYPSELLEVVVEDPGSVDEAALRRAAGGLHLSIRPAADARAVAGMEAASGAVLVLLAAGALPERELVEAHARWHHAVADAVSVGTSHAIEASGLTVGQVSEAQAGGGLEPLLATRRAAAPAERSELDALIEATAGLTDRRPDLFRIAERGSLGVRHAMWREAGGRKEVGDARLARLDLAYRLDCAGCVFVPEDAAVSYQGGGEQPASSDPRTESLLPVPGFRRRGAGRVLARPAIAVDVPVGEQEAAEVLETVDAVLRGHLSDLVVRVQVAPGHPVAAVLEEACAADPRVGVGEAWPEGGAQAPFRVTLPPPVMPSANTFQAIHDLLSGGDFGVLRASLPGRLPRLPVAPPGWAARLLPHAAVEAVATGPLARSTRIAAHGGGDPRRVLVELFGERSVHAGEIGIRARGAPVAQPGGNGALAPPTDLAHERAEHLRYRARAATNQSRLDRQTQRLHRERLRASHERTRAERLEARLARVSPAYWLGWKAKRVGRRLAALPGRAWRRVSRLREPLYRLRLRVNAAVRRRRGAA